MHSDQNILLLLKHSATVKELTQAVASIIYSFANRTAAWVGAGKASIHPYHQPPAVSAENEYGFWSPLNNSSSFAVCCCHTLKSSDSLAPRWHLSCRLSLKSLRHLQPQALQVQC